jgi:hypothetical protein
MNFDFSENRCALECCGEFGPDSSGFSLQEQGPHRLSPARVLWFCTKGCLVQYLIERGDVTDGFSLEWGRHQ